MIALSRSCAPKAVQVLAPRADEGPHGFDLLPEEMIVKIFELLSRSDQTALSECSREFHNRFGPILPLCKVIYKKFNHLSKKDGEGAFKNKLFFPIQGKKKSSWKLKTLREYDPPQRSKLKGRFFFTVSSIGGCPHYTFFLNRIWRIRRLRLKTIGGSKSLRLEKSVRSALCKLNAHLHPCRTHPVKKFVTVIC